jgi:hypothetical protein
MPHSLPYTGDVPLQEKIKRFLIHECAVLNGVVAGAQRVLDSLIGPAMTGHFQPVVVRGGDHGMHLLKCHAERVMVVRIGRGRIAGRVGLDPFDAVLDKLSHGGARLLRTVNEQDQPFHTDLAEVWIPIHEAADATDLPAAGGKAGPGSHPFGDRLFQPDVDVKQAAATARGRVAAFESEAGVGGGEEGDVFDRILDIEVFEGGDVEVRWMEVSFDKAGHDGAAASVDDQSLRRHGNGSSGVLDAIALDDDHAVPKAWGARTVDQRTVANHRGGHPIIVRSMDKA